MAVVVVVVVVVVNNLRPKIVLEGENATATFVVFVNNLRPKIVLEGENATATFWTARAAKAAATRFMVRECLLT